MTLRHGRALQHEVDLVLNFDHTVVKLAQTNLEFCRRSLLKYNMWEMPKITTEFKMADFLLD